MATRKMNHYSTLSSNSKKALQSGNSVKMLNQLKKLQMLHKQGSARIKGSLHRHVIAMKQGISRHIKQLSQLMDSLMGKMSTSSMHADFSDNLGNVQNDRNTVDPLNPTDLDNNGDTLSKRWMRNRKMRQLSTRKRVKAVDSLNEAIYKYYYQKLTKLTKMTVDPVNPSYTDRAKARSAGFSSECNALSYEEKFRILLFKVNIKWKPRDYIQRKLDFRSLFSRLCTSIMDCIRKCTSYDKGDRLDSMNRLDNLFRILRRFKISSATFIKKRVYRGGGPKKDLKGGDPDVEYWGKRNVIGKDQLAVPIIDSLSEILKGQFRLEHGLLNVGKLYRASRISGPVSQRLQRFNLKPIPIGSKAVQIHFCRNHYVTSEQLPSGIVVWDSLQTSDEFKEELYPQLRLTYDILSQYNSAPKGVIKYKNDRNNMQQDNSSCGIYAVLRALFILNNASCKINTDTARQYLSNVLKERVFTDYSTFSGNYESISSNQQHDKMSEMLGRYMRNQNELQSKKQKEAANDTFESILPKASDKPVRKRGRPAKYSIEERAQKYKETKLRYYHKTKGSVTSCSSQSNGSQNITVTTAKRGHSSSQSVPISPSKRLRREEPNPTSDKTQSQLIMSGAAASGNVSKESKRGRPKKIQTTKKRGRPAKYSPEEQNMKQKMSMKFLRQQDTYREVEKEHDQNWHKEKR